MTNIRACWASRRSALIGATTRVINKRFIAVHEPDVARCDRYCSASNVGFQGTAEGGGARSK
jgi:hypothetical protein